MRSSRPVVRRLLDLIRLRNTHPAFDGDLDVDAHDPRLLRLVWRAGDTSLGLEIDVSTGRSAVVEGDPSAELSRSGEDRGSPSRLSSPGEGSRPARVWAFRDGKVVKKDSFWKIRTTA